MQDFYLSDRERQEGTLLLLFEKDEFTLSFYRMDRMVYWRLFPYGLSHLTGDLVRSLPFVEKYETRLLFNFGDAMPDLVTPLIVELPDGVQIETVGLSTIVHEKLSLLMNRVVSEMASMEIRSEIRGVVLAGEGCVLSHMTEFLSQYFTVPIRMGIFPSGNMMEI